MNARIAATAAFLAALGACAEKPAVDAGVAAVEPGAPAEATPSPVAPAIIPPEEAADPTEPPSYEVALASAAATRNQALERCAKQPSAVRTQCEQEANASFAQAEKGIQDLRGNTQ